MSIFKMNFNKAGKGVEKDAPAQNMIFQFFESIKRNFWGLIKTGFFFFIASIPLAVILGAIYIYIIYPQIGGVIPELMIGAQITDLNAAWANYFLQFMFIFISVFYVMFGAGPASAAFAHITKCMANEEHTWIFSDFRRIYKENFKQSLAVLLIDFVVLAVLFIDIVFYLAVGRGTDSMIYTIMLGVVIFIFIFYVMMHGYIYQMIVTFDNKLKILYKNAFIMTVSALPKNFLLTAIPVVITIWLFSYLTPTSHAILMATVWMGVMRYPMEFFAARSLKTIIDKSKEEVEE